MSQSVTPVRPRTPWSSRTRFYLVSLIVTMGVFIVGRVSYETGANVQLSLPLSCLSIMLLCVAAFETYLLVNRVQTRLITLDQTRQRDIEEAERRAFQRHQIFNQISRVLLDKLDIKQVPVDVFEKIAGLFHADLVVIWVVDKQRPDQFTCRGAYGLKGHNVDDVVAVPWAFPQYAPGKELTQAILTFPADGLSATLTTFCEREEIKSLVLDPIVRRDSVAGALGVFFRQAQPLPASYAEEIQTVSNLIAGAVQAEELYHDLVRIQKVESVGTLASGIAHDFNNVLAAILACATYCKQHTDPDSQSYRYLEATEASAHRGAALTKQLLSFVRREDPKVETVNVNEHIDHTMKMLERSLDKSILIQRQYAANVKPVEVDPSMLEQVILNLAVNARDAMPQGGFYSITTKLVTLDSVNPYRPKVDVPDGEYVVLGFRDTGCGMDAATMKRIFEPFFTTKKPGKGTGLGLSLIMNIVHNAGGEVRVESTVGVGTLFEIYLPASNKPLPQAAAAGGKQVIRGGGECILIAEDEDIIREMAQVGLEDKGYKVIPAADGAAAVARFRENWRNIDLVVIDMAMPRLSGPEVFERMKEINPGVRVIVSSGYSSDQEGKRMLEHGCLGFLQKPYTPDQLSAAIRAVLDSGL